MNENSPVPSHAVNSRWRSSVSARIWKTVKSEGPQVSVVIPCWNAENVVGEAIESALAQTYPNVEVIVIDDGSTDGSLKMIRSFGSRVRWETGPNRGACAARNRGLQLARGDLIQFLDADDIIMPDKIAHMVPLAVASGRGIVPICDGERLELDKALSPARISLNYQGEDPVVFCLKRHFPTPSPLHWRANLHEIGGFDEALPCSQEHDMHLRLCIAGLGLFYLPEVLYTVRVQRNSVSSDSLRVIKYHEVVYEKALNLLYSARKLNDARCEAFARAFAKDARHLVRYHNQTPLACRYLALAESIRPGASLRVFGNFWARSFARVAGPISTERVIKILSHIGSAPFRSGTRRSFFAI